MGQKTAVSLNNMGLQDNYFLQFIDLPGRIRDPDILHSENWAQKLSAFAT